MNTARGSRVPTSSSPRPSSRASATAAGRVARNESGPCSIVKPSTCSVATLPPSRASASTSTHGDAVAGERAGGDETRDPTADDETLIGRDPGRPCRRRAALPLGTYGQSGSASSGSPVHAKARAREPPQTRAYSHARSGP